MWVERAKRGGVGPILLCKSDRTHEPSYAREQKLGIAHAGLDFEGSHAEITKIRRMAKVSEHEDGAQCHEKRPGELIRMIRQTRKDGATRCGRKLRKASTTARLVARENQREMLEDAEESTDLHSLSAR